MLIEETEVTCSGIWKEVSNKVDGPFEIIVQKCTNCSTYTVFINSWSHYVTANSIDEAVREAVETYIQKKRETKNAKSK